jgi:uncharacterized protein (DUF779 family)
MLRPALLLIGCFFFLAPLGAQARDTEHFYPAADAKDSELGQQQLFEVPFYLKGQQHPKVSKTISEIDTQRSTRGAFRSDGASCEVAFLSAMKVLQQRAQEKGGNAIIDVVSTTRGKQTESTTDYRCVAGSVIVHVGLKGKIVELAR